MKFNFLASSIIRVSIFYLSLLALLTGCDSVKIPDITAHDQVPLEVKAEPRLVETLTMPPNDDAWPRLGDVPFKPKDFSTKPVYDHYMNELEYQRAEAEDDKKKIEGEAPILMPTPTSPISGSLMAPQFVKE